MKVTAARKGSPDRSNTGANRGPDRRQSARTEVRRQLGIPGRSLETAVARTILELDSTAVGEGASLISVQDPSGVFTATNLEAVLGELRTAAVAAVDHGATTGRSDDDHSQYTLASGTRAFSGNQSMGSNKLQSVANGAAVGDAMPLLQILSLFMPFAGGSFTSHVNFYDNALLKFGTGGDSTITYDGTNTTWDPKAVGSGYIRVNGKMGFNVAPVEEVHAADTVRADTKFNHNGTDGLTGSIEFYDALGGTQTVTINGGIITAWTS